MPDHQEGLAPGVQRGLCRGPVLRASAQQAAEILLRVHGRVLLRGGGRQGGQVRLQPLRLLTAPPPPPWALENAVCFSSPSDCSCLPVEIFEIYCKIQNRLIFIMRRKTFFLHLGKKTKRREMLERGLPQHRRRVKEVDVEALEPWQLGFTWAAPRDASAPPRCPGQTEHTCATPRPGTPGFTEQAGGERGVRKATCPQDPASVPARGWAPVLSSF